jgi:hypothetical protein
MRTRAFSGPTFGRGRARISTLRMPSWTAARTESAIDVLLLDSLLQERAVSG